LICSAEFLSAEVVDLLVFVQRLKIDEFHLSLVFFVGSQVEIGVPAVHSLITGVSVVLKISVLLSRWT
jgi:hypothetical protein